MSARVLPHASDLRRSLQRARGATPLDPRGGGKDLPQRARRRIRDDARDGLAAAAVSLGGSIGITLALAVLLRWLG